MSWSYSGAAQCTLMMPPQEQSNALALPWQHVLMNRADGSLGATAGDWNGDGFMDIFVANAGAANEILMNDGAGSFIFTLTDRADASAGATAGDWNGDGFMDIFVANYGANEILMNDGAGSFISTLMDRADWSSGVTAGDWNGDGFMDIFVANNEAANEILMNDGAGSFISTLTDRAESSLDATAGDWNGDGSMDIFVANIFAANEIINLVGCPDGYSYTSSLDRSCYVCPAHTTDSLHPRMCEFCPAGRIGVRPAIKHDQRMYCIPCEAGKARSLTDDECSLCPAGRYAQAGSSECSVCATGFVTSSAGTGSTSCTKCNPGEEPNANRTRCLECSVGKQSTFGNRCDGCPSNEITNADQSGCRPCPVSQVASPDQTQCVCQSGSYNSSYGLIFCFEQEYFDERLQSEEYTTMRIEFEAGQQCLQCPVACVRCETDVPPTIMSGWSLSPEGHDIWGDSLNKRAAGRHGAEGLRPRSMFRCNAEGEVCERDNITNTSSSTNRQCAAGHHGSLCGSCTDGWKGSFGELCTKCRTSNLWYPVVGLLVMSAVVGLIYGRLRKKASAMQGRLDGVRAKYALAYKAVKQARQVQGQAPGQEDMEDLDEDNAFQATLDTIKIVIGNLQIIAQLPIVLKFSCPACTYFREMTSFLPAINLDVLRVFSVDCLAVVGLYQRFIYTLVGPTVLIILVRCWGTGTGSRAQVLAEDAPGSEKGQAADRAAKANSIIMLIVFLLYPSVSTTIFSVFACRNLDFDQSTHVYDADIDCNSAQYLALKMVAFIALILVPIGVPVFFGALLFKNRVRLNAPRSTGISFEEFSTIARSVMGTRALSDRDLTAVYENMDVNHDGKVSSEELWKFVLTQAIRWHKSEHFPHSNAEKVLVESPNPTQHKRAWWFGGPENFRFIVRTYESRCYWWELTLYLKKFILSGVLIFASPGSVTQLYVALIVSFYFFALLARTMPYKNAKTDQIALLVEANLFFTILCILMLKINLSGELLTPSFYDQAIVLSNTVAAFGPLITSVVLGLHKLASDWVDSAGDPLAPADRVRILECPDNLRCCGHIATVVSSNKAVCTLKVQLKHQPSMHWRRAKVKMTAALALAAGTGRHDATETSAAVVTSPTKRSILCSTCRTKMDTFELELNRDQLQLILGRHQFLRLCVGVLKLILLCRRGRDNNDDEEEAEESSNLPDGIMVVTADVVSRIHEIEGLGDDDDDINLKEDTLRTLQSVCEPILARRGLKWEEAKDAMVKLSSVLELQAALRDPEKFIADFFALLAPALKAVALKRLRPHVEPTLAKHGLTWEQAMPVLSQLTSIDRLHAAADD
eukprot:COSAG02_NODE_4659_length_5123_cov_6.685709_1_plen_1319_part_10